MAAALVADLTRLMALYAGMPMLLAASSIQPSGLRWWALTAIRDW